MYSGAAIYLISPLEEVQHDMAPEGMPGTGDAEEEKEAPGSAYKLQFMIASRDNERRRMEEARAAQSQTVQRAKESMANQWKRTRSEQVSEHRGF